MSVVPPSNADRAVVAVDVNAAEPLVLVTSSSKVSFAVNASAPLIVQLLFVPFPVIVQVRAVLTSFLTSVTVNVSPVTGAVPSVIEADVNEPAWVACASSQTVAAWLAQGVEASEMYSF